MQVRATARLCHADKPGAVLGDADIETEASRLPSQLQKLHGTVNADSSRKQASVGCAMYIGAMEMPVGLNPIHYHKPVPFTTHQATSVSTHSALTYYGSFACRTAARGSHALAGRSRSIGDAATAASAGRGSTSRHDPSIRL